MCGILTLIFIGFTVKNVQGITSSAIPELLYDCYSNDTNTLDNKLPLTMQMFLEIIRKIELHSEIADSARILATSILHSVTFNGIRRTQSAGGSDLMIPFRATGEEFYKYRLLVDYLTSGESSLFPKETLSTSELCLLHIMVSNTVDKWKRGDESTTCTHQSNLPFELDAMEEDNQVSSCPIKKGSVFTKWGSVSVGHVIAAIASALQKQTPTLERIEDAINNATNQKPTTTSSQNVNNVWVATIAGDLANVVLKQASRTPEIGTGGFWNDTLLPRVYYLESTNWDTTETDILGSIDGLSIARYIENKDATKIRLSQLIDMFYSPRGIMNNTEYGVSNRSLALNKLLDEVNLGEQVEYTSTLLQEIGIYDTGLNSQQINEFASIVTDKFKMIAGNITKTYDSVESIHSVPLRSPVEIILILDGSYEAYNALQVIHGLAESVQVSDYGSRLGVINGQSGKWMANVTSEQFQLFTNLGKSQDTWPSTLSLGRSLESVIYYYENRTTAECLQQKIKPSAQTILILSRAGQLTDNDLKSSLRAFNSIKKSNPETSFILVTSSGGKTSFMELTRNFWDNDYILSPSGSINSIIQDISKTLSTIPGNIINFYCSQSQVHFEDYITPNLETWYQIRKEYIEATPITTKFANVNYGTLFVCAQDGSSKSNKVCKDITVNDEIRFDSLELCMLESACNLEFSISVNSTQVACIENSCRYPDQVRLEIIWQRSSGYVPHILCIHLILISTLILIL